MKNREENIFTTFYPETAAKTINFEATKGQYIIVKNDNSPADIPVMACMLEAGSKFIFNYRLFEHNILSGEAEIGFIVSQSKNISSDGWLFLMKNEKTIEFIEIVDGEAISSEKIKVRSPRFFQLSRNGNELTLETASGFKPMEKSKIVVVDLEETCYVGMFVGFSETATFKMVLDNVRFIIPAPENFVPYTDYGKSCLEILDISTCQRKIVLASEKHYEAPNWTSNNQFILNSKGLLYTYNQSMEEPEVIDTGFATSNNNDHGLSYDEKHLFISHHVEGEPHNKSSRIFMVPIEGGEPTLITPEGPSYWHGLSPNGKEIAYTGQRMGYFNIYRKHIDGGDEFQLTMNPALDDGPEYSHDGNFIYFNTSRGGKMKIWKMRLDGSEQEQITFDEYNDWFPHISPDGSKMVFLSYPPDVQADDHPYYKQVMIRMVELDNNCEIKTLAFVYGGQGTINVPSWSKDGNYVAFCSYGFFN